MQFSEHFLLSVQFVVKFIVAVCRCQECVAICYEQIENIYDLYSQMENVAFFDQVWFLIDEKFQ